MPNKKPVDAATAEQRKLKMLRELRTSLRRTGPDNNFMCRDEMLDVLDLDIANREKADEDEKVV